MDIIEAIERENILTLALSARTHEQIKQAVAQLDRWVADHPDDIGITDAYEQMGLVELALEEMARAKQSDSNPKKVPQQKTVIQYISLC